VNFYVFVILFLHNDKYQFTNENYKNVELNIGYWRYKHVS